MSLIIQKLLGQSTWLSNSQPIAAKSEVLKYPQAPARRWWIDGSFAIPAEELCDLLFTEADVSKKIGEIKFMWYTVYPIQYTYSVGNMGNHLYYVHQLHIGYHLGMVWDDIYHPPTGSLGRGSDRVYRMKLPDMCYSWHFQKGWFKPEFLLWHHFQLPFQDHKLEVPTVHIRPM